MCAHDDVAINTEEKTLLCIGGAKEPDNNNSRCGLSHK